MLEGGESWGKGGGWYQCSSEGTIHSRSPVSQGPVTGLRLQGEMDRSPPVVDCGRRSGGVREYGRVEGGTGTGLVVELIPPFYDKQRGRSHLGPFQVG